MPLRDWGELALRRRWQRRIKALHQASGVEQRRYTVPGADELHARYRDDGIVDWHWKRQRRIACKVHGRGVLQCQHLGFEEREDRDERQVGRALLQGR